MSSEWRKLGELKGQPPAALRSLVSDVARLNGGTNGYHLILVGQNLSIGELALES